MLEPVVEAHAEELWRLFGDRELHRYVPVEPKTLEEERERCRRWARRRSPSGDELWLNWVARHLDSDQVIGHFQAGVRASGEASIGYLVAREHQRQGYAAEGLSAVMRFLRAKLAVHEIKAWIDSRNEASIRLVTKLGMRQVDFLKDADYFKGATSDEVVYSIRVE